MEAAELNIAELGEEQKAEVRAWAIEEAMKATPAPNSHMNTIRRFLVGTISVTALVAGKWADWSAKVEAEPAQ